MTRVQTRSELPLREVLYQFAMMQDVPDVELLDEFVRQYPEYAESLTNFAGERPANLRGGGEGLGSHRRAAAIPPQLVR